MNHQLAAFHQKRRFGAFRWWMLPSWLGFDAPVVVSVWLWALSRGSGQVVSGPAYGALFCAVWAVYLTDRLIDVARCRDWDRATGRLRFGKRFRAVLVGCLAGCLVTGGILTLTSLPGDVMARGLIVAAGVAGYFLIFVAPVVFREKPPGKEFVVGLFFAMGVFAVVGAAAGRIHLLTGFGIVASFNCLVIGARDSEADWANDPGGASRWWRAIDRDLTVIGLGLTAAAAGAAVWLPETAYFAALAAGFFALTTLHLSAKRFPADAVRAVADFCLLTPLALAPWL